MRTISGIYRALAILCIILGIIGVMVGMSFVATGVGVAIILLSVLYAMLGSITSFAIAEGIYLMTDIESNTRASADLLRKNFEEKK